MCGHPQDTLCTHLTPDPSDHIQRWLGRMWPHSFRSEFANAKTATTNSKSPSPSCKLSVKSEAEVVSLLVKSVSLWQHVCTSLSSSVSKVLSLTCQHLAAVWTDCLHWFHHIHSIYEITRHFIDLNTSHFTLTLNSNNIGYFFVPIEKVPRLPEQMCQFSELMSQETLYKLCETLPLTNSSLCVHSANVLRELLSFFE